MKIVADANIPFVKECFGSLGNVELCSGREMNADIVRDADCLLVRSVTKVGPELLEGSRVRFVGTATIGFDHIDMDYLQRKGVGFASAPGSNANSVAEYIIASLLNLAEDEGFELTGKSIGVIGVGNVGSKVVRKAEALGLKTVLNDPPLARQSDDEKYRPISEVMDCDIVTVHTPLTYHGQDKTFHLCDKQFFERLANSVVFLNTSRGAVVDTAAMKQAIAAGKISAAVLDVWESEPTIGKELLSMINVATPHIAGYSFDGKVAGMIMIYIAACEYFGVDVKYTASDFLPGPVIEKIELSCQGHEQQTILDAVAKVYDIMADDKKLRAGADLDADEFGPHFARLRKEYPVRREFQNTKIIGSECCRPLLHKLSGIGFALD